MSSPEDVVETVGVMGGTLLVEEAEGDDGRHGCLTSSGAETNESRSERSSLGIEAKADTIDDESV